MNQVQSKRHNLIVPTYAFSLCVQTVLGDLDDMFSSPSDKVAGHEQSRVYVPQISRAGDTSMQTGFRHNNNSLMVDDHADSSIALFHDALDDSCLKASTVTRKNVLGLSAVAAPKRQTVRDVIGSTKVQQPPLPPIQTHTECDYSAARSGDSEGGDTIRVNETALLLAGTPSSTSNAADNS